MLLFLACTTGGDSPADTQDTEVDSTDPATVELAGECPMAIDHGGFLVAAYTDYSIVDGRFADGVVPLTVLEELVVEGDCRLLRRNNPHCEPTCSPEETCDFDGTCLPYPEDQDLGHVTVSGLSQAVGMDPRSPGAHYFDTTLEHPGFEPDALIRLDTAGVLGEQRLYGVGVAPLELGEENWILNGGSELHVTWNETSPLARSHVVLRANIDQHGTSPASVVCVFEDDGAGVVPATMVTALVDAGVSGFPTGSLSRQTADSVTVDGECMDFIVSSPRRAKEVRVEGFTPCDEPSDCPPGQECNFAIELCEDIE